MSPYVLLDHPADIGIRAHGATRAEAFAEVARGLVAIIVDPAGILESEERVIELAAADEEQLLVRWLSEVLYLYDGPGFVGSRFTVEQVSRTNLRARITGERFDPSRHVPRLDVKAVTYHQLRITEGADGAEVVVYLDI